MDVGFIGLGNVGGKLAASVLRNGFGLTVHDATRAAAEPLLAAGALWADHAAGLARRSDVVITCLPSPAISREVMQAEDGILTGLRPDAIWLEMSTTDEAEVLALAEEVQARGGQAMDCPVSGGCHRAATGNISIFAGGARDTFEQVLPILAVMGRNILHTGGLGSASVLKVVTNYLCSVHLAALGEAFTLAKLAGMDMNTTYEAIRISSGNSFVHETESQVILNGSYDINFTMDLVEKDMGLFAALAQRADCPVEIAPLVLDIFRDARQRYGARAWSPMVVRRLEEACGVALRGEGFPEQIDDDEPEQTGAEVRVASLP